MDDAALGIGVDDGSMQKVEDAISPICVTFFEAEEI